MATFFLIIIYLAFISLGLPDSLLGSSWPVMQPEFGVALGSAGFLSMTISGSTIVSSLASGKVLKRFGTGPVSCVSAFMTAAALLGFSYAPGFGWLLLLAVPLGLGAGAIDAGLNNYVALYYKAHHMSWLHCFWGVGAMLGPIIMARFLVDGSWRQGYLTISGMQFVLVLILFLSLPLWRRSGNKQAGKRQGDGSHASEQAEGGEAVDAHLDTAFAADKPLRIRGVNLALLSFLFYSGIEAAVGLWGASFLVDIKGLEAASAAKWISFYYGGITVGRLITGFITLKLSNRALIRWGQSIALLGALLLVLPLPSLFTLGGFILIGLGLAPIFPCLIHETPRRFGRTHSQTIIGYQMAFAYTGSTIIPPLAGLIATRTSIGIFPFFIVLLALAMVLVLERLDIALRRKPIERSTGI